MTPLITVIIPVFNVEKYLKRSLDSIIQQTYTNLEIIVVDDGSTDQSGNICDKYSENDSRIIVIHKKMVARVGQKQSFGYCEGRLYLFSGFG